MGKINGIFATKITGRVGQVVFRDRKGTNVVSQKPASVSNPRTAGQQWNRMIMRTVVAAYSSLKEICDHSFEGVAKGSLSQSLFMKQNIAIMQSRGQNFNLRRCNSLIANPYLISKGSLRSIQPTNVGADNLDIGFDSPVSQDNKISYYGIYLGVPEAANILNFADEDGRTGYQEQGIKVKSFLRAMGINAGEQLTFVVNYVPNNYNLTSNENVTQATTKTSFARIIIKSNEVGFEGKELLTACAFDENGKATSWAFKPERLTEDSVGFEHIRFCICKNFEGFNGSLYNFVFVPEDISNGYAQRIGINQGGAAIILSSKTNGVWNRSTSYFVPFENGQEYFAYDIISSYDPKDPYYLNNALPVIKVGNPVNE